MRESCSLRIRFRPRILLLHSLVALLLFSSATGTGWNEWTVEPYQTIDDSDSQSVQITIYPTEENIREGREGTFDCRARAADGTTYPEVRWTRYGAPLPVSAYETDGRLTFTAASLSDSGRYVCSTTYGGRNYEAYAQLNVQPYGPQEFQGVLPQSGICRADERACGNNECVKSDYICDGEPDCRDRSDEQNCPSLRSCEPNEFKCNNGRCVQKMWLCDGDDDCGDNSDEQTCTHKAPSDGCSPTEFRCRDGRQCVPQSFHCDGTNDCHDGSDEIGCVQPTVVQAPETNKQVSAGDTFQLTCKAVAVPEPYINWRLNWGPVCDPPRCVQHSEGGLGTLTVNNAQPLDQGAYTCEAINVKGRVLATPDCIVRIVNIPAPQPQSQQTRCNAMGSVSPVPDGTGRCQCKSLVVGAACDSCSRGAYHLHEKAPEGCLKCFCFGVTDQCRSSSWYRTKDKLIVNGNSQGVQISDADGQVQTSEFNYGTPGMVTFSEPHYQSLYWKLPSRFIGNKLTAYGGELAFDMQYSCAGPVNNEPLVILKGNGITLMHRPRDVSSFTSDRNFRYTVDTYEGNYEEPDGRPATRENLLMVLADLDTMLIRASHCHGQQSTSLGDVSWEVAVDRDTQERLALEVEQCSCPPGYTGLSCEDCAPGYERSRQGPYLGTCVPAQRYAQCSAAGAISTQPAYGGQCQCKTYATGSMCDQCPPNTFHMSPHNPQGCIPCFCSGVTQHCSSSSYYRTQVLLDYTRDANDQLEIVTSDAHSPFRPQSQPQVTGRDITFSAFYEAPGQTLYWKMPAQFLGNKVTSYGGTLKYTIKYSGSGPLNTDADVILRGNDIALQYRNNQPTFPDRENTVEVKMFEDQWQRVDGQGATREHLIMALADLDVLLIKISYLDECSSSSLISVSLDYAEPHHTGGEIAYEVEQCQCPPGYIGTSCEDCAPGYSRSGGGLYLGLCERCECHGHASQCDKEHGFCIDCQHNTEGDQCERCKPGFTGDARRGTPHDCQPAATRPACLCNNHSPRGCDSFGRCLLCEHNTEGYHCEQCKRGYYGEATRGTPYDCTPCPCPGASDCFLDAYGQVQCRNCPAGLTGRLCDECAPGYTRSRTRARVEEGRSCEPIGHVEQTNIVFVPTPEAYGPPLRVQIDPPKNLHVSVGSRARWYCRVIGQRAPGVRLQWSKVGTNGLPSNAAQYDGELVIDGVRESDAGQYRCTATGDHQFATDDATLDTSVARQANNPMIDPPEQTVNENDPARFRCWVPGNPGAVLRWRRVDGNPLGYGVSDNEGVLSIPRAQMSDAGEYVCSAQDPDGGASADSPFARLNVERPRQPSRPRPALPQRPRTPQVDPKEQTVKEGDPAQFHCWISGDPNVRLKWSKVHGAALPYGASDNGAGVLYIPRAQASHADLYVCSAIDPRGGPPVESIPVELKVEPAGRKEHIRRPEVPRAAPEVDPLQQTVEEGDPAQIRCFVPGEPHATLTWRKQDGHLPDEATQDNGNLYIPQMENENAGNYVCSMEDPAGGPPVDSVPARIDVRQPQVPQVDPPIQTVDEGAPSRIRCWVEDNPHVQLSWSKEDGELPHGSEDSNGLLTIPETAMEDAGEYICTLHDPNGGPPIYAPPATINVRQVGKPPQPVATPTDQVVKVGEPARFHCEPNSVTPAKVSWGYESADGPLRGDVVPEGDDLVINSADESVAGDYICTATNEYGTGEAEPVRLHVSEREVPPTARVVPRVWNGQPGEKHQFQCITTGSPEPTITWTGPDDEALPEDVNDIGGGFLDFQNARTDMNGDYTCTAKNIVGEASDHGSVNIGPSLTVRTTPPGPRIVLTAGEPLEVKCEAFGEPEPEVEWLHDPGPERGDLPDDFKPVTISEQFIRHPAIGVGNAGVYTCRGSNIQASAKKDIYIEVVEPSKVATVSILGGSTQWLETGKAADLVCAATGSELVDRMHWVKVDGALPNSAEEKEPGILHFSTFRSSDNGDYECRGYRNDELIGSNRVTLYATNTGPLDAARVEIDPPAVRVVNQGDSIELTCTVEETGDPYRLTWYRSTANGSLHLTPTVMGYGKSLQLHKADFVVQGFYWVQIEFASGESSLSRPIYLLVHNNSLQDARIVKFDEKSDATIECPVYEVPGAHVTWKKEDGELPAEAETVGNKLVIREFNDEAVGMYICKVEILGKQIEGNVKAEIYVPDTIIQVLLESSSESIALGDRAWFDCKVTGDEDAEITWTKEGEDGLPDNAQVTGNRLLFVNVREDNGGIYKCRAKTKAGPLETRTVLNVGNAKRKRKHLSRKKEKRAHKTVKRLAKKQRSIFGGWFKSS